MKIITLEKDFFLNKKCGNMKIKKFQDLNLLREYQIKFYHVHYATINSI